MAGRRKTEIGRKTEKEVWGLFAGRCAMCREKLVEPVGAGATSLVGEVAHIVADKPDGPRGDSPLSAEERNEADNLLLLCRKHHKIVDDHPGRHTTAALTQLRQQHLEWVERSLLKQARWSSKLSQISYINVPHFSMLAAEYGFRFAPDVTGPVGTLHSLEFALNGVMESCHRVLERISPNAVKLDEIEGPYPALIGRRCSFNERFRTKNVPLLTRSQQDGTVITGDLALDPHIYVKKPGFKFVMVVQPKWITTSTAMGLFRPSSGQSTFAGLCTISNVDPEAGIVYATPLVLGLPKSLWDELAEAADSGVRTVAVPVDEAAAAPPEARPDADLEALEERDRPLRYELTYTDPPDACDLCGRDLDRERFMVDGKIKGAGGMWGNMCPACFRERGTSIGWGIGQLYRRQPSGEWLLVGGFDPGFRGRGDDSE